MRSFGDAIAMDRMFDAADRNREAGADIAYKSAFRKTRVSDALFGTETSAFDNNCWASASARTCEASWLQQR
jgi:hypothetical protein